jgi:hypothetical protein
MMMKSLVAAIALIAATPALSAETPLDAARVGSARTLLNVIVPPAKRDAMIDTIMRGMMGNIMQTFEGSPELKSIFESDARAGEIFTKLMKSQQEKSITLLKANFPGMIDAMTNAYARRFTTAQMSEMQRFFETPTGQTYIDQAPTIMTDPDVAQWQRDLMGKSMSTMGSDIQAAMAEIKALKPKAKSGS